MNKKDPRKDDKRTKNRDEIAEKMFQHRDSLLTDLFRISHIKTIRNVFISVLIIILFQIIVFDLTTKGQ
jgi:hypothetical protein